jgi:HAMP domain-containing protein
MFKKISIKVALFVNIVLFIVIGIGTIQMAKVQFNRIDEQYKAQAKFDSLIGAKAVSKLFEEALDGGVLKSDEIFDTKYQPYGTFDPPKFHTKYDAYTDRAILALQDEMLKNPSIIFAVSVDNYGYLPTHNTKYSQSITGDKDKDRVGNRTKRIFDDPTGLAAAKNTQPGFLQVYKRDTGETMWDVSSPIIVKGKQWGNFRIGLSIDLLQKAKITVLSHLLLSVAVILIVSFVLIFFTIKSSLQPLVALTEKAHLMADGDVSHPIIAHSKDEIGELAEVLERMRISLKTAMERLMKR